jgi:hypothetical protein
MMGSCTSTDSPQEPSLSDHRAWRDIAEQAWNDLKDVSLIEQATFAAQMATYEVTRDVATELKNLQSVLTQNGKAQSMVR